MIANLSQFRIDLTDWFKLERKNALKAKGGSKVSLEKQRRSMR